MASKVFKRVGGLNPGYSAFDLSYEKKLSCDMGQLIPVMCDEVVPGDRFKIGNEVVVRMQPMVAPVLHEINCYVHYFFVPYRLLWKDWEKFITGGKDGKFEAKLPTWETLTEGRGSYGFASKGSLWDYFGFPFNVRPTGRYSPSLFPLSAYLFIFNEYYRDQNLQDPYVYDFSDNDQVDISANPQLGGLQTWMAKPGWRLSGYLGVDPDQNFDYVLLRNWEKDYFTSSLPWQQRGTAPALPLTGVMRLKSNDPNYDYTGIQWYDNNIIVTPPRAVNAGNTMLNNSPAADSILAFRNGALEDKFYINLNEGISFNISDLRLAFQIQKWLERNARCGVRYTEFLKAHFGVHPRDERLDRPEYIGGSKSPIIISEVLQTSGTDKVNQGTQATPQGNLAGHGITADRTFCGSYHAKEYGLIMGIMSIMPRSAYSQGIDRQWLRRTKYDFYFREFANLSEQAIEQVELYATNGENPNQNGRIFGYQGRYDEMRVKRNMVVADMRNTFEYWHLGRKFSTTPYLNESFIECRGNSSTMKRIFASTNDQGFLVNFGNIIKAIRPMPIRSEPGFIDHN